MLQALTTLRLPADRAAVDTLEILRATAMRWPDLARPHVGHLSLSSRVAARGVSLNHSSKLSASNYALDCCPESLYFVVSCNTHALSA